VVANGFWDLTVDREGIYEIELRRWPKEANASFDALASPFELYANRHNLSNNLVSLPSCVVKAETARIIVGNFDETIDLDPGMEKVKFQVPLETGDVELNTFITDKDGLERGAYYVYVEREN
jgi:arylsulfatase